jgi:hypothetical protein
VLCKKSDAGEKTLRRRDRHQLFHDPVLAARCVAFALPNDFFARADLLFAVGNLSFTLHYIFHPDFGSTAGGTDGLDLTNDLFDDRLGGRSRGSRVDGMARRASDDGRGDKGTREEIGLALSDLCLADSNVVFPGYQSLGTLRGEISPKALGGLVGRRGLEGARRVVGVRVGERGDGCDGDAIGGEREHHGEDGEDERENEEEGGGGDGAMVMVTLTVAFAFAGVAVVGGGGVGHCAGSMGDRRRRRER